MTSARTPPAVASMGVILDADIMASAARPRFDDEFVPRIARLRVAPGCSSVAGLRGTQRSQEARHRAFFSAALSTASSAVRKIRSEAMPRGQKTTTAFPQRTCQANAPPYSAREYCMTCPAREAARAARGQPGSLPKRRRGRNNAARGLALTNGQRVRASKLAPLSWRSSRRR